MGHWRGGGCMEGIKFWQMTQIFLCLYTEDEEEDEDNTEPKAGLESDQKEDEESKDTKEGKTGLWGVQTFA